MTRATDEALELAFAHGLPYAGLRDHRADPALGAVVPDELARVARVVVLRADGERVRLAAAEPRPDLAALGDSLAGRAVEIAIAPRDEIDALLGPAPAAPAEPEPEPPPAPVAEPSWLAPEPRRGGIPLLALVAIALVVLAAGAVVAVWLAT